MPSKNHPNSQDTIECTHVLEQADENFVSWIFWDQENLWDTDGNVKQDTAVFFARPYPIATSGIPVKVI